MILPSMRDPRFITIRRGGSLTDSHHHLLVIWAAKCAEHVLELFEKEYPSDDRPRKAIEAAAAWVHGAIKLDKAKEAAYFANAAARDKAGAAKFAALSAGQAAAAGHVAAHELGAAAYAIRAAMAASVERERERAGRMECEWQREQLPEEIRELVIDDENKRNDICWNVFTAVTIRKANEEEIGELLEIWHDKAEWLIENNMPMWDPSQFSREGLKKKYVDPEYYVCRNDEEIIGGFILIEYDERYWKDYRDDKAYYFHKFVVRNEYKARGYSDAILEWVKKYGKEMGKDFIRLDYNEERAYLKAMYERHGFEPKDKIRNEDGDLLITAEYAIKS